MITKYLILFTAFFGMVNYSLSQMLTVKELKEDIEFVFKKVESIHVNPYFKYSKEFIDSCENNMIQSVIPMDTTEFNLWIVPRVNWLFDSHTQIQNPHLADLAKIKKQKNQIINFSDTDINDSLTKVTINASSNNLKHHRTGTFQLVKIGKYNTDSILQYVVNSTASDLHIPFHQFVTGNLGTNIAGLLKYNLTLPIEIMINGIIERDTILFSNKLILRKTTSDTTEKFDIYSTLKKNDFTIWAGDSIAILNLRNFNILEVDYEEYTAFIDGFFDSINQQNIGYLFINLNDNYGGSSDFGMYLLDYICNKSQEVVTQKTYVKKSEEKVSQYFEYYKWKYKINDSLELISLYNKLVTDTSYNKLIDSKISIEPKANSFIGQVLILQSKWTYSAPIMFLSTSKYYKLGIIVGEETRGLTETYIAKVPLIMPNSKIPFSCSTKYSKNIGSIPFRGVIPDLHFDFENISDIKNRYYLKIDTLKSILNKARNDNQHHTLWRVTL